MNQTINIKFVLSDGTKDSEEIEIEISSQTFVTNGINDVTLNKERYPSLNLVVVCPHPLYESNNNATKTKLYLMSVFNLETIKVISCIVL